MLIVLFVSHAHLSSFTNVPLAEKKKQQQKQLYYDHRCVSRAHDFDSAHVKWDV